MNKLQGMTYMQFACISSAYIQAPLSHWTSLTKHKYRGKIIKNFKMATAIN